MVLQSLYLLFSYSRLSLVVVVVVSFELYEAGRDVVEADLFAWLSTRGEGVAAHFIEQFDLFPHFLLLNVGASGPVRFVNALKDFLGSCLVAPFFGVIPDAVAGQDDKLDLRTVNLHDLWLTADHLVEVIHDLVLLELKVSKTSGYGQLSLDATLINEAASRFDSFLLLIVSRLVVIRHRFSLSFFPFSLRGPSFTIDRA